jgi:hypothetical protein
MHIKFKNRIQNWSEAKVIQEIEVRKTKIALTNSKTESARLARFGRELRALSDALVLLRTPMLLGLSEPGSSDASPIDKVAHIES